MKTIRTNLLSAFFAIILSACSSSPFGGVPSALADYNKQYNKHDDGKYDNMQQLMEVAEKNQQKLHQISARIEQEARKLNGKTLDIDLNNEIEIVEPIKISFLEADGGSVYFALKGKAKACKDITIEPWNDYQAKRIDAGKMVGIVLAVPAQDKAFDGRYDFSMIQTVGAAPAKLKDGKIVIPAGGEIFVDCPRLCMYATDRDDKKIKVYKAASKKLWLTSLGASVD